MGLMQMFRRIRHLLIFQLGLVMVAIVALAIMSATSSLLITDAIEGKTDSVNIAGSLRMQSYRIAASLLNDEPIDREEYDRDLALLIDGFQLSLLAPALRQVIPGEADDLLRLSYQHVLDRWRGEIRPLLINHLSGMNASDSMRRGARQRATSTRYLERVPGFVEDINGFVALLALDAETRVSQLYRYQLAVLLATLLVTGLALLITYRKVHKPLKVLMCMARRAGQGDFKLRTSFDGDDELGGLGQAFNLMAGDLYRLYDDLESMVKEKTVDLERSRKSLELLYKTAQSVSRSAIDQGMLARLLKDIEELAETGPCRICLANQARHGADLNSVICLNVRGQDRICAADRCDVWQNHEAIHRPALSPDADGGRKIAIPIADQSRQHGVLLVQLPEGGLLEDWQQPLLKAVATNIGIALTRWEQVAEQRRLALLEERGVIARELHDSLAQGLSYLKIQVARLQNAVDGDKDIEELRSIIAELRAGIGSAYSELRELLTTFRLRMDEQSLNHALQATVDEFTRRGGLQISLHYRIGKELLMPHEEIHLLHVVRESLWNVFRHSGASGCSVVLEQRNDGRVFLTIDDDGSGFGAAGGSRAHYGLMIMQERVSSLGGSIGFDTSETGGARIEVNFIPESINAKCDALQRDHQ